jgi:predicted transcriptional regulator of viral defense system
MKIEDALKHWLLEKYDPVAISRQSLYQQFLRIWIDKSYDGELLTGTLFQGSPRSVFYSTYKKLEKSRVLIGHTKSTKGYSFFTKKKVASTPEQVASGIYPYGYLSHLSAMNAYKLGSVESSAVYFTCLNRSEWNFQCVKDLKKSFKGFKLVANEESDGEVCYSIYLDKNMLVEDRSIIPGYPSEDAIEDKNIILINKHELSESEWWAGVKVQNIIDLFIDMLRYPQYCGGLQHVIAVYKNHIDPYFEKIVRKLDRDGSIIDRARFGFVAENHILKEHPLFEKWKVEQKGKRGGSRKLVSTLEFDPKFDPVWNISINHDGAKNFPEKRESHINEKNYKIFH